MSDDLGPLVEHHAWRARPDSTAWPLLFALLFTALGGFMIWLRQPIAMGLGVLALGFAGFMVMVFVTSMRDRHDVIDVHERGVVAKRRGVDHAWPWAELRFRFSATRFAERGRLRVVNHHQLARDDASIPIDDDFPGVAELVAAVEAGIVRHQAVTAAKAIAAGETRGFGPLAITKDGVAMSVVRLAWSELSSLDIAAGMVTIRRHGEGEHITIDYARLWNAALALVLIRAGIAGVFESGGPLRAGDVERHIHDILIRSAEERIPPRRR